MKDFTLSVYQRYVTALKENGFEFILFRDYLANGAANAKNCCMLRHDVDRKPLNALKMAELEYKIGLKATYYFRYKSGVFDPKIIRKIENMGHEVGYHYENLSDVNGNMEEALIDFEKNLFEFRKVADVKTISMHGRPFKSYDNRNLWRDPINHKLLKNKFGILGEVYLDIDYKEIAYINDTGRNWHSTKNNLRDITNSKIDLSFSSAEKLLQYFQSNPYRKIVFQIHPERWSDDNIEWGLQYLKDCAINSGKILFSFIKR